MSVLDAKLPAWQASTKTVSPTKVEALKLEGKAPLSVDGGGLANGKRVLLKDQAKAEQNGLWEVTKNEAFGAGGTFGGAGNFGAGNVWSLTRTADADSGEELEAGMFVPIEDGDTNQATSWIQRTEGAIEVGTTALSFEPLLAGARGNASGSLEGVYAAPAIAEAVIGSRELKAEAVSPNNMAAASKETFPQLGVSAPRHLLFGRVGKSGEVLSGSGFSAIRTEAGKYTIKLTTELSSTGTMVPCANETATLRFPTVATVGKREFTIEFRNQLTNYEDTEFSFFVIG